MDWAVTPQERKAGRETETPRTEGAEPKIIVMKTPRPSHRGDPTGTQNGGNTVQKASLIALSVFPAV